MKTDVIYNKSCLNMGEVKDNSVDLIITSPPYFGCRIYEGDEEGLGRELDPRDFVDNLLPYMMECQRVLKKSGNFYLNIGDSYFGNKGFKRNKGKFKRNTTSHYADSEKYVEDGKYLQFKQLLMVPERLAIKMQDEGWILRNKIVWQKCLHEDSELFVKQDGEFKRRKVKDLHSNFKNTYVLSQDKNMNEVWVKIKDVTNNGNQEIVKITTKSGREVDCSKNHVLPFRKSPTFTDNPRFRKFSLKKASEFTGSEHLLCNSNIMNENFKKDYDGDFDLGFVVGFYMAEGCKIFKTRKPLKNNPYSLASQKRWRNKPRGEYEAGIQFACGVKDIERGYLDIIKNNFKCKQYIYGNSVHLNSYDDDLLEFLNKYIDGYLCDGKSLKDACFNESVGFMKGVVDGFLSGDGHDDGIGRWRVGIKPNMEFKNDIELLCRILDYDFRFHSIRNVKGFDAMTFSVRTSRKYRNVANDVFCDKIDSIVESGVAMTYDIEVEPLYTSHCGKGATAIPSKDKKLARYNNLYFLSNGIMTHNSNAMPHQIKDRRQATYETIFHFVKSKKNYFNYELAKDMKNHKDVINCNIHAYKNHQATFPIGLIEPLLMTSSKPGHVVLDPFMGSGTTAVVASNANRRYIGYEQSEEYCKIIYKRIQEEASTPNMFDGIE